MNIILASRSCELCNGEATVYCPSDIAFLCWRCDAKIHDANFLVARHLRNAICSKCKGFTGLRLSGPVPPSYSVINIHCSSCCSPSQFSSSSSSSSSSARVSSTISASSSSSATKKIDSRKFNSYYCFYYYSGGQVITPQNKSSRNKTSAGSSSSSSKTSRRWLSRLPSQLDFKAEAIFVNWCRRLGRPVPGDVEAAVLLMSRKALSICWDYMAAALPFRLCLAASLWFGFRFCGDRSFSAWQLLKGLEEISGIPAKLISAAESKLESILFKSKLSTRKLRRQTQPHQLEEGWGECSA